MASDPDGSIARVEFFADGNYLGSATNAPYTNNWPQVFSGSPAIPFLLTARAIDTCGAVSTSAPVAIYVIQDIHPPLVVIEKPLDGALYRPSAPIQILASVRPSDGSENPVSFYAGSNLLGVAPEPPYSLTVSNLPPGRHMITAENTDDFYQTGSSRPIALTVVDLVLDSPRFDIGGRFKFNVTGVATGSSLVLLGSSNLFSWEPIATNFPVTPQLELVVESPERQAQRYFRVVGEK